ncbi:MAG: LicD family protein [Lachnospiraceae bacterium]|nr:LicD family protein [Lachnospiraceae bacterium]
MREYDDYTLKKVQELELSILKDFVEICEREGFRYFLEAGSLLGAIRHKGFIPWDDDIDVGMPRKDYMKFLKYAKENLTDKYNILNLYEYENYPLTSTQLALKDTTFVIDYFEEIKGVPFGIFLDIFPMDYVSDDEKIRRKQILKCYIYGHIIILKGVKKPYIPYTGLLKKFLHFGTATVHYMLNIFKVSPKRLCKKMERTVYPYRNGTKWIKYIDAEGLDVDLCKWDDIFPTVPIEFCGLTVQAPKNWDKYLKNYYGDYMQLPPVEKRKNHFPAKLDFGKYK